MHTEIGTLIGMKSMDEGKHDIVCTICSFLTSYKWPSLQPGNVTEKVAWYYFWHIANEYFNRVIVGGETWTRNFSTTVQCVNHYTMGHPYFWSPESDAKHIAHPLGVGNVMVSMLCQKVVTTAAMPWPKTGAATLPCTLHSYDFQTKVVQSLGWFLSCSEVRIYEAVGS